MGRVDIEDDNAAFGTTTVKFKRVIEDAIIPTRGSTEAAGWDLYNNEGDFTITPHTTVKINTGIAIALPKNTFGGIFARSGLATKQGLRPSNCCGVIDSDYRGPAIVALHNDTDTEQTITRGERIAQLIVIPYLPISLVEVAELDDTERGEGGFGSTGTH